MVVAVTVSAWMKNQRLRGVLEAPDTDDRCLACNSVNLTWLDTAAYRCHDCGLEGGSGLGQLKQRRRIESAMTLPPEERRSQALKTLGDARAMVVGAQGTLQAAHSYSMYDIAGFSADRGARKQHELFSAVSELIQAQRLVQIATNLLGQTSQPDDLGVDFLSTAFLLDTTFDNLLTDLAVHQEIERLRRMAQDMLEALDTAIAQLG